MHGSYNPLSLLQFPILYRMVTVTAALFGLAGIARTGMASALSWAINEVMVNPAAVPDETGEWIELINQGTQPASTLGLQVILGDGQTHVVSAAIEVPAGGLVVLGRNGDPNQNGGIVPDYVYGPGFDLPNSQGQIRLAFGDPAQDLDVLDYGDQWQPAPVGRTLNREPEPIPATANHGQMSFPLADQAPVWCASSAALASGNGDWGTPNAPNTYCDFDGDGTAEDTGDCDDNNVLVSPDIPERCNGLDDDCDGQIDEADGIATTMACFDAGICTGTVPTCMGAQGWVCLYAPSFEEPELSCDGRDNDCDGQTDENLLNACGQCGPPVHDTCNAIDDDCDGETDEEAGGSGDPPPPQLCESRLAQLNVTAVGVCGSAVPQCLAGAWQCTLPSTFQLGGESLCDGVDNDCDGWTDEDLGLGAPCVAGTGVCMVAGSNVCRPDGAVGCSAVQQTPSSVELCGDQVDNDCDGEIDEGFRIGQTCTISADGHVFSGQFRCSGDGRTDECEANMVQFDQEQCNDGVDNDLDGITDESDCQGRERPHGCGVAGGPDRFLGWTLTLLLVLCGRRFLAFVLR